MLSRARKPSPPSTLQQQQQLQQQNNNMGCFNIQDNNIHNQNGTMASECKARGLILEDNVDVLHQRLGQLNQLRKNRHFCDLVLQVGSSEIHAHRSVLACASPYFFELFTQEDELKTAREGRMMYKLNGGFERESIERLVNYAYTGVLDVPDPLVKTVFKAAMRLKMETVAHACGEHLVAHMTPETCLSVRAIAGIRSNEQLCSRVDEYIQQQNDLVVVTRDALGVPKLQVAVIHSSQEEAAITGHALSRLVLDWVKRMITTDEYTLDALKDKKHMLYLSSDNSLHDCMDIQNGAANDSEMVQDYKKMSRKQSGNNLKSRRTSTSTQPAKPRMMLYSRNITDKDDTEQDSDWKVIAHTVIAESSMVAIITLKNDIAVLSIQHRKNSPTSSPTTTPKSSRPGSVEKVDSYTVIPHMFNPKCASGTGNLNGRLLVCGGYDRGECLRDVEAYLPKENSWSELPSMKQGRGRFDLTVLDEKAYAIGGCDGTRELSRGAGGWPRGARPLPFPCLPRPGRGVCNLDGKIYCIGGWNGQYGIKQCDRYDPQEDTWTTIAPLNIGRYQAGVAALDGIVYAVGGCDSWNCLNTAEAMDTAEDTWRFIAPMATPRRGCGAAIFKGKLYVMGGSDGTQSLCTIEIYDPKTNTWRNGPSMTSCRANVGAAVVDGKLYVVGGFSGKNFLNSIEYLDPDTDEWTNFTPKPEYYVKKNNDQLDIKENGHDTNGDIKENGHDLNINGEDYKVNDKQYGFERLKITEETCKEAAANSSNDTSIKETQAAIFSGQS
ncbi:unnamed protein product, partial [Meganyctiphanes norvegica]